MDPLAPLALVLAHGGTPGLLAEIGLGLLLVVVALLAWRAARDEDDDERS